MSHFFTGLGDSPNHICFSKVCCPLNDDVQTHSAVAVPCNAQKHLVKQFCHSKDQWHYSPLCSEKS